jgi:hypothetical protein
LGAAWRLSHAALSITTMGAINLLDVLARHTSAGNPALMRAYFQLFPAPHGKKHLEYYNTRNGSFYDGLQFYRILVRPNALAMPRRIKTRREGA